MPSVTLKGAPEPDAKAAATFYRDWFDDENVLLNVLTMIDPIKLAAEHGRTDHLHNTPSVWRETFETHPMEDLIYSQNIAWNLYMGVGLMENSPGRRRKGGKKDIVRVPGVWVDLDVGKDGCFRNEDHALSLLRGVLPYPTIVVATGTGGVHGYWKVQGGLSGEDAEDLTLRWWTHLSAESDAQIDRLANCDRVMKLPGSIRWEKDPGDQPALVRLVYSSPASVRASELAAASELAWRDYRRKIDQNRRQVREGQLEAMRLTAQDICRAGRWGPMMAAAGLEDEFNENHTWHDVLVPIGWTDIGQDSDGRTLWARPDQKDGATYKSAATDYDGSHVMALFSEAPETGLRDLNRAGIPLTKYRVWVQTRHKGDEAEFVRSALNL